MNCSDGGSHKMLKLAPLSQPFRQRHFDLLAPRFNAKRAAAATEPDAQPHDAGLLNYLANGLETILLGSPAEIEAFAQNVKVAFPDFSRYAARHKKGKAPADDIHRNTLSVIHACFDYDWFSDQMNGWGAYALVDAYQLRICPYCHASQVNFHVARAKGQRGAKAFRMRPPLDHYLPKSAYPYLAVSLSNLIPSCAQCNSGVKTASDTLGKGYAHPLDGTALRVTFSMRGTIRSDPNGPVRAEEVEITLIGDDDVSTRHVREFKLQERYGWFRHEVKDLVDRHEQHREFSRRFREVLPRELYVLGFREAQADSRVLGRCLRDIFRELDAMP